MTGQFNEVLEKRLQSIKKILTSKAQEYATNDNRYHNFDEAAKMLGCTPEQALWGMLSKHIVSVQDMVNTPHQSKSLTIKSYNLIDEKIGDAINYLILLEGMMKLPYPSEKELSEITQGKQPETRKSKTLIRNL